MNLHMKLTKCEQNHFFDADKFLSCPHCANQQAGISDDHLMGQEQAHVITAIPSTQNISSYHQVSSRKTTGWLVCINGSMVGESFVLREGENHIGRAGNMDVPLVYEPSVSKENHAIISYDSEENCFLLISTSKENRTLCNNKPLKNKRKLKKHDIITLGNCLFMFIPFCSTSFSWEKSLYS